MNDAMQLVAKVWYRLYWGVMLACSVAVAAGYVAAQLLPGMERYAHTFALDNTAAIIAGLHIVYSLTGYWLIRRRREPLALSISSMLFGLVLLYGLANSTGMGVWAYIGAWLAISLLVGMYGLVLALGSMVLALIFVLLESDFATHTISQPLWVLLAGNAVLVPLGYLFWRRRFISPQDQQVSQLSGMLRSKQEQSAILIQSLTDGVIVTDTEGKIGLINPAAAKLTGWSVNDASGVDAKLVAKLAKENGVELSADENPFTRVLKRQEYVTQTLQLSDRSESKHIISFAISPVITPGGVMSGAVAVMRDISQEHAAEQQRAEFISTASHEMRTPVAAIEGYLALALNDKVSTIDSRARGYLEKAHYSTQHLGKLFQDLLTSAKAEDGRLSNHPVVIEMGAFTEQLMEDLKFSAQKKGLVAEFVAGTADQTIDATKEGDTSMKVVKPLYYVQADPDRLREVITNLFDNAIKYTDQGKISVGLTGDASVVQLYVHDTGPGIPLDDIPHLFQKFYRVDSSATRIVGGTGLGLFISRKIIELYGGRIWAESELGKGSTFFINLPRLNTQHAQQLQAAESTQGGATSSK